MRRVKIHEIPETKSPRRVRTLVSPIPAKNAVNGTAKIKQYRKSVPQLSAYTCFMQI